MAFLTLNNVVIPTSDPVADRTIKEYGERAQAFDGTYQVDIRNRKRVWSFKTKPVGGLQAQMLRGLIQGQQVFLPYDTGVYSSAGQGTSVLAGTNIRANVAPVSPFTILDENGNPEAKVGAGSLTVQRSVTNLLTAAQASCSDSSKYITTGAGVTLSNDSGTYLEGSSSLKTVVTGASIGYLAQNAGGGGATITGAIGDTIYVSGYFRGTAGQVITIAVNDRQHTANLATKNLTFPTSGWQRASVGFTLVATTTDATIKVTSQSGAQTWWSDMLQVENVTSGNPTLLYPGSWVAGATTQAAGNLRYNGVGMMGPNGMTFSAWATKPPGLQPEVLFALTPNPDTQLGFCVYSDGSGHMILQSNDRVGTISALSLTYAWDNAWHLITGVMVLSPKSGETNLYLYADGVLLGSGQGSVPGTLPTPSQLTLAQVGQLNTSLWWGGRIDEVQILPYPVDQTWVTGTLGLPALNNSSFPGDLTTPFLGYNTVSFPDGQAAPTPYLYASGDAIDSVSAQVMGQVTKEEFIGYYDAATGAWRNNGVILDFTLTEV